MLLALVGAIVLALPRESWAQRGSIFTRAYDPNAVETVSGRVVSIEHIAHGRRGSEGVHLLLNTPQGRLAVHLGPGWFMDRQALKLEPREVITVTGSRVVLGGRAVLIASRITKGRQTLILRSVRGLPVWRGSKLN